VFLFNIYFYANCNKYLLEQHTRLDLLPFKNNESWKVDAFEKKHNKYDVFKHENNVVNNVDISSLGTPWQNGPYKNKHTEQHKKHAEHPEATDIHNKLFVAFLDFYLKNDIHDFYIIV